MDCRKVLAEYITNLDSDELYQFDILFGTKYYACKQNISGCKLNCPSYKALSVTDKENITETLAHCTIDNLYILAKMYSMTRFQYSKCYYENKSTKCVKNSIPSAIASYLKIMIANPPEKETW